MIAIPQNKAVVWMSFHKTFRLYHTTKTRARCVGYNNQERSGQSDKEKQNLMLNWISTRLNKWVLLGAVGIAIFLCVFWGIVFNLLKPEAAGGVLQPAEIVLIPAPTITPSLAFVLSETPAPGLVTRDGIFVGAVVQISGTDGAGLRLRSEPGTASEVRFIGMDAEAFEVREGPQDQDDIVWWYLVSPYDEARSGWAASGYLTVVEKQS